jgi:DNA-binding NarL/FixJ family response regulator
MNARSSAERRVATKKARLPHPVARSSARPIGVIVADGDPLARAGIKRVLGGRSNIRVVGEAADGDEAVRTACALKPDIVLLDVDMPGLDAVGAAKELKKRLPACRAIILTTHRHGDYLRQLAAAGVKGYLHKDAVAEDLLSAIDAVHRGRTFFSDPVTRTLLAEPAAGGRVAGPDAAGLTVREREILVLIANGETNRGISLKLRIGLRTAETHRESLMRKLDIGTIAGLTKYAISRGLTLL